MRNAWVSQILRDELVRRTLTSQVTSINTDFSKSDETLCSLSRKDQVRVDTMYDCKDIIETEARMARGYRKEADHKVATILLKASKRPEVHAKLLNRRVEILWGEHVEEKIRQRSAQMQCELRNAGEECRGRPQDRAVFLFCREAQLKWRFWSKWKETFKTFQEMDVQSSEEDMGKTPESEEGGRCNKRVAEARNWLEM